MERDGNNLLQIKGIEVAISTFETLPVSAWLWMYWLKKI
jgi:hypothetical protein